jgi:23S rRNA (adenine2503-C2)-methyltransferase
MSARLALYDLTRPELIAQVEAWGLSPVHGARLWSSLYYEGRGSFEEMTDLPVRLRTRLMEEATIAPLPVAREQHSSDGFTRKYLLALADGRQIETVLMRYHGRTTACISSQVGCAMASLGGGNRRPGHACRSHAAGDGDGAHRAGSGGAAA